MERIDKIISVAENISRKEAGELIKCGAVSVNGSRVKSVKEKFNENNDLFCVNGKKVTYNKYVYIMMNKPKGVISASEGKNDRTVVDILPDDMKRKNLFPAGRLDKDTTGFMLITDDGDFAHKILSPKNHIPKTYIAELDKPFDDNLVKAFEKGVELKDDLCMPAKIETADGDRTKALVTIKQGMYHQIKRMFKKFGITVLELKRIKMGNLPLDLSLKEGECRYLSADELNEIKGTK
ncbi:MAG: pseudouridine synthase [Eubacteriales bacterium]|nr:pseudouridine synthase [Eubacteriales bacterium]